MPTGKEDVNNKLSNFQKLNINHFGSIRGKTREKGWL